MEQLQFEVNGLKIDARFSLKDRDEIFLPLLKKLSRMQAEKGGRLIVFLAAPPAAGKSTLCCYLEKLSREYEGVTPVQCAGLDGFHYPQKYLNSHSVYRNGMLVPLSTVKGAPESFDVKGLMRKIDEAQAGDTCFPVYDRRLHDPVENALEITEKMLLIEGNWLLLDEPVWRDLPRDFTVFIEADEPLLRERVIDRRLKTGRSLAQAQTLYDECDGPNIRLCMNDHTTPDVLLAMTGDGKYEKR